MTSPTASSGTFSETVMIGSRRTGPACCMASVRLVRLANGFEVRNARRLQVDLDVEALLEATEHDLDVDLRQAGDDLLAGLVVAVEVDRRVLLLQRAQAIGDLVLVALGLR